jgi:hypothetical protein
MHAPFSWLKPISARPAAIIATAALAAAAFLGHGIAQAQVVNPDTMPSVSGTLAPSHKVTATLYAQPPRPNADQLATLQAGLANSHRSGPTNLPRAANAAPTGPALLDPATANTIAAASDFLTATWHPSFAGGFLSGVGEPSGDNSELQRFHTGNWYAALSNDRGGSWSYVDPFSLFGSGFCCDQVAVYDPGRNVWFWLLQYVDGHLVLANSTDRVNWCSYSLSGANVGLSGGFDYNDMTLTTNNVNIASNFFPTSGPAYSVIIRISIDDMVACAGASYTYAESNSLGFTFKPVSNGGDVLYWGTDWFGTLGSNFRIFKWPETSGITLVTSAITPFAFYTRNSGQFCGSADGVVKNWCQFGDSRVLGGSLYTAPDGTRQLVFSANAAQGGNYPFPYINRMHFKESDLTFISSDQHWGTFAAFQYGAHASDSRGHLGLTGIFGGGVAAGTDYYPGTFVSLTDDVTPSQPWTYAYPVLGNGNACTAGGLYRYGDYMTVRPYRPASTGVFLAYNYVLTGDAGDCGNTAPVQLNETGFLRRRDLSGATRWN